MRLSLTDHVQPQLSICVANDPVMNVCAVLAASVDRESVEKVLSVNAHQHVTGVRSPVATQDLPVAIPRQFFAVRLRPPRVVAEWFPACRSNARSGWHSRAQRDR